MHLTSFDHLPCSNAPSNEPHTVPQTVVPPKKVAHTRRPKAPVDLAHCPLPVRLADCSVNARPGVVPGRAARTRVSPGSNLAPTLPEPVRTRPADSCSSWGTRPATLPGAAWDSEVHAWNTAEPSTVNSYRQKGPTWGRGSVRSCTTPSQSFYQLVREMYEHMLEMKMDQTSQK